MLTANNSNKEKVFIKEALQMPVRQDYYCPVCGQELIIRNGLIKFPHFSHRKNSIAGSQCDSFKPLFQTAWYLEHLKNIPKEQLEPVIVNQNTRERHLADAISGNTVILFLDGALSSGEFKRRNLFYISAGYKVVWLINASKLYDSETIRQDSSHGYDFRWYNPYATFHNMKQTNNVDIYLEFGHPESRLGELIIDKVESFTSGMSLFSISGNYITSIDDFLATTFYDADVPSIPNDTALLAKRTDEKREGKINSLFLGEQELLRSGEQVEDFSIAPIEYLMLEPSRRREPDEIRHAIPPFCPNKNNLLNNYILCYTCPHFIRNAPIPPGILPFAKYIPCNCTGSNIELKPYERITNILRNEYGLIEAVQTKLNGMTHLHYAPINDVEQKVVAQPLAKLWHDDMARMRVINLQTGWHFQIGRDPSDMMRQYKGRVFSEKICSPSGSSYFKPLGTNEIYDATKPIWQLEWYANK